MKWMLLLLLVFYIALSPNTGLSETKKVVIIDTGLDLSDKRFSDVLCPDLHRDFTKKGIDDINGHGTFVASLIAEGARSSNYCIVIVKFFHDNGSVHAMLQSLRYAFNLKPSYINISGGGDTPIEAEYKMIANNPNVTLVVAAGNGGKYLKPDSCFYPACYKLDNIVVVGGLNEFNLRADSSNYGPMVTAWESNTTTGLLPHYRRGTLSGTSMSTAIHTSRLIKNETN